MPTLRYRVEIDPAEVQSQVATAAQAVTSGLQQTLDVGRQGLAIAGQAIGNITQDLRAVAIGIGGPSNSVSGDLRSIAGFGGAPFIPRGRTGPSMGISGGFGGVVAPATPATPAESMGIMNLLGAASGLTSRFSEERAEARAELGERAGRATTRAAVGATTVALDVASSHADWVTPQYIAESLSWLEDKMSTKTKDEAV